MNLSIELKKIHWLQVLAGGIVGILLILGIRFATYNVPHVHYHANFAVYINGQREEFKGSQYYQEVSICSASKAITMPQQRTHMHDDVNSVAHVHDHAVTWGQFFENLGWYVGPDFVQTASGKLYRQDGNKKLHIVINNQDYTDLTPVTNMVIKDKSRLLVSFGDISQKELQKEYKTIPSSAAKYDAEKDTSACSGDEPLTFSEKLHHLF